MANRRAEARRASRGNSNPYTRKPADAEGLKNQPPSRKPSNPYSSKEVDNLRIQLNRVAKENKNLNDRIRILENRASLIERVVNQLRPIVEKFARIIR